MSILKKVKKDQLSARKDKNKLKTAIYTSLVSEIAIIGKNQGIEETLDSDSIKVIIKFKKGADETLKLIKDTASPEKIAELEEEIEIYNSYLPKLMSENDLSKLISDMIDSLPNPNIGMIMGQLKKSGYAYDGKLASKLIKEKL